MSAGRSFRQGLKQSWIYIRAIRVVDWFRGEQEAWLRM
jgi:hypothetical protein